MNILIYTCLTGMRILSGAEARAAPMAYEFSGEVDWVSDPEATLSGNHNHTLFHDERSNL